MLSVVAFMIVIPVLVVFRPKFRRLCHLSVTLGKTLGTSVRYGWVYGWSGVGDGIRWWGDLVR